jgi:hypothetical protein
MAAQMEGWELGVDDMATLDGLEEGLVTGWDPVSITPEECDRM